MACQASVLGLVIRAYASFRLDKRLEPGVGRYARSCARTHASCFVMLARRTAAERTDARAPVRTRSASYEMQ